jgi:predicted metallopeptidase
MPGFMRFRRAATPSQVSPAESRGGLNLTERIQQLCVHLAATHPDFSHVDMSRTAVRICQTRTGGPYGVQATMTPLRFAGGATVTIRRGRRWAIDPMPRDAQGRDHLYLFSLYVPRFLDLPHAEKIAVVFHELWHISPEFDGDLRRFPGRYHAHGSSCEKFHLDMRRKAAAWLASRPEPRLHDFLDGDLDALRARYGRVFGTRIPTPRLRRIDDVGRSSAA